MARVGQAWVTRTVFLFVLLLCFAPVTPAQYYQLPPSSAAPYGDPLWFAMGLGYTTIIDGYVDPFSGSIKNTAAGPVGYSINATYPSASGSSAPGIIAPGVIPAVTIQPVSFNPFTPTSPGAYTVTATVTDTYTGATITLGQNVTVLSHGKFGYVNGTGQIVPLSTTTVSDQDLAAQPQLTPESPGGTGGGETHAYAAPNVVGDPASFGAELDLDSVTAIGDPEISVTLTNYLDIPDDENPAHGLSFQILVDGSVTGTYFTVFELNYSDEQDLPGADAPGSEHQYFGVYADVTSTNVTAFFVVPEPSTFHLLPFGFALLLPFLPKLARRGRSPLLPAKCSSARPRSRDPASQIVSDGGNSS